MIDQKQLDRIENGVRFLVKVTAFPMRRAFDGIHGEELSRLIAEEMAFIDRHVKSIMDGDAL